MLDQKRLGYRGYISGHSINGARVPQHIQNVVIRQYCDSMGFQYLLSEVEHIMPCCKMVLHGMATDCESVAGIVLYSLFQLPGSKDERKKIYQAMIEKGRSIHFSVERMNVSSIEDIALCEDIISINEVLSSTFIVQNI